MINYLPRCYPIAQQMPRHQLNRPKKRKSNFLRILNESQIELKKLILQYFKKKHFHNKAYKKKLWEENNWFQS